MVSPAHPPSTTSLDPAKLVMQPLVWWRSLIDYGAGAIAIILALLAVAPLISMFYSILRQGGGAFSPAVLFNLPVAPGVESATPNGFANALLGTAMVVACASLMSIPLGLLTGIFLAEFSKAGSKFAGFVRFVAKVLTSVPSIIVGAFAYAVIVYQQKSFSAFASAFAVGVLMVPIIALTTEESLKLVPNGVRQASAALGGTRSQGIFRVVLPSALPGIVTGILLAVARAAGETAPVLMTSIFTNDWPQGLWGPTPTMSVLIYTYATSPDEIQNQTAWVAALTLLAIILFINIASRLIVRRKAV